MNLIDAEPYSRRTIGCAIEVHRIMGPGLLESIYETCLCHELTQTGLAFDRQQRLPVIYKGHRLNCDLKADIIVEKTVLLEIKSVQAIHPLHDAQPLTDLKVSGLSVGLLLNFNVPRLVDGLRRRIV